MRTLAPVVAALVASLASLLTASPANASDPDSYATLQEVPSRAVQVMEDGTRYWDSDRDDYGAGYAFGGVHYRVIRLRTGKRVVELDSVVGFYQRDDTSNSCGYYSDRFREMRINFYLYDLAGRNRNPTTFSIGCAQDGTNSRIDILDSNPRLHYVDGKAPRWRAHYTIDYGLATPNREGYLKGYLAGND